MAHNQRFALLASHGEILFHAGDVATLWKIQGRNTLYKTLSRYAAQGLIVRIHKGFYSLKSPFDIDPYLLGVKALHRPAYISCESVLFNEGILNQVPAEITVVSSVSKRYGIAGKQFRSRKMREGFLMNDAGIEVKNGVRTATVPRAIADMLYFNPAKYFDAHTSGLVDWKAVTDIARKIGYTVHIPNGKMKKI